ncbi:hypothetical protein [Nocardiopsis composta]|uniref:Lipoprotein n=1 Tax=Nocardiopsis composta TaxID=157465 RepID=A0A7W8VGU3_9ACTN|nr:hypothetical protein [Nocardiopsis composta]MBB5435912.1 hypothetical protein [Nocardiopsis composta]
MRPFFKAAVPAFALALLLAGCSGGEDAREGSQEQGDGAGQGSPGTVEAGEAIAEGTFSYPELDGEITFEIHSLQARGDLMQMDYSITPEEPASDAPSSPYLRSLLGAGTGANIYLIDMENLLRYETVADEDTEQLEPDPWETAIPYGEKTTLTAFFAAPRDGMKAADVYFYGFQPIMNVPVSGAGESE